MAQTFDVTFKFLFRRSQGVLSHLLFGDVVEWPNVEQPEVRNLRADLLAKSADGSLRHVELQVTNDTSIAFRMLEYYVGFYRTFGQHVQQTVLYAGREPLRMIDSFATASTNHQFTILSLREMDGSALLESDDWTDNEWALLTKADPEKVIRVVFDKLRTLSGPEQETAASTFVIIGGILGMEDELSRRLRSEMIDLMQNKVLGPAIRQGLQQGLQQGLEQGLEQGLQQGLQQGRQQGMAHMLQRQLEKRFGRLPSWAIAKLALASPDDLESWSLRLDEFTQIEQILA